MSTNVSGGRRILGQQAALLQQRRDRRHPAAEAEVGLLRRDAVAGTVDAAAQPGRHRRVERAARLAEGIEGIGFCYIGSRGGSILKVAVEQLLAPVLTGHLAPGGTLILAGLLERQVEELQAAYAPWLQLNVADAEEGWVLLSGTRPV